MAGGANSAVRCQIWKFIIRSFEVKAEAIPTRISLRSVRLAIENNIEAQDLLGHDATEMPNTKLPVTSFTGPSSINGVEQCLWIAPCSDARRS
jgi:hypothetical protein